MDESCRRLLQEQVDELFRLAEEAESCARLLRQEARRYQQALDDDNLDQELVEKMIAERKRFRAVPNRYRITDNLM